MATQTPTKQPAATNTTTSSTRSSIPSKQHSRLSGIRGRINGLSIPKPVAIGGVVLLLLIAGWSAYSFLPQPVKQQQQGTFQADTPENAWMREKIRETGGDVSRLTKSDRAKADEISRSIIGMSADVLFKSPDSVAPLDFGKYQQSRTDAMRAQEKR